MNHPRSLTAILLVTLLGSTPLMAGHAQTTISPNLTRIEDNFDDRSRDGP